MRLDRTKRILYCPARRRSEIEALFYRRRDVTECERASPQFERYKSLIHQQVDYHNRPWTDPQRNWKS